MKLDLASPVRGAEWDEPISVDPAASVRQVAVVLARHDVGAAVVRADERSDAGLVSERDVVRALAQGRDPDGTQVRDIMSPDLVSVGMDAPLGQVIALMDARHIRHVALVDGDEVVGVVSARDLLGLVARTDGIR